MKNSATLQTKLSLYSDSLPVINEDISTFKDNLSLPIHRWFRFSAGFSAIWVRELINKHKKHGRLNVLDPFAGSGTVLIESEIAGVESIGLEAHPFIARIAKAKLSWRIKSEELRNHAALILKKAHQYRTANLEEYPPLIKKCYSQESLSRLDALRRSWEYLNDESAASELSWLALVIILRECASVGTAQWQYVLPNKLKAHPAEPFAAFQSKINLFCNDIEYRQRQILGPKSKLIVGDARDNKNIPSKWADLVITSPPYANNYDYADCTRLEMSFFRQIQGWGDLQSLIRQYLVRSCTQHVAKLNGETYNLLDDPLLEPIRSEITSVCRKLEAERKLHGGNKPYYTMIAAYFLDMAKTWENLYRITKPGGLICFVIGDSAPYGIYVPVDEWFGEIAKGIGFKSYQFEKTRDRNVKWKNRKHRVPLKEGRLWVKA